MGFPETLAQDLCVGLRILRRRPGFREAIVRFLILLQCSVACVLLIACANVANLMLEHASARRQEMDVRLALGASRGRLISLFLTEGLLIAALGTAAGLVVAVFTRNLLTRFGLPFRIRLNIEAAIDWRVLGFALALCLTTVLLFGLWPAFRASRAIINAADTHGAGGRTIAGRSPHRLAGHSADCLLVGTPGRCRPFHPRAH
jgi:putative ABC transport system permease protein